MTRLNWTIYGNLYNCCNEIITLGPSKQARYRPKIWITIGPIGIYNWKGLSGRRHPCPSISQRRWRIRRLAMAAFPVLHYHRLLLRPGLHLSRTPFSPPFLRPFSFPVSARSSSSSSSSASTASRGELLSTVPCSHIHVSCSIRLTSVLSDETEEIAQQQQQLIDVNPPRGTRDFPPEDMRLRNWLFQHFREVKSR